LLPHVEGRRFCESLSAAQPQLQSHSRIEVHMRFEAFSFGSICIDGTSYAYDVVIDRGRIRKC
jgi:hypothetical protein